MQYFLSPSDNQDNEELSYYRRCSAIMKVLHCLHADSKFATTISKFHHSKILRQHNFKVPTNPNANYELEQILKFVFKNLINCSGS